MREHRPARILISLTTIPPRMDSAVHGALDAAVSSGHDVLLSVPRSYRKWGTSDIPASLAARDDIILHRPDEDFGAATKLMGALDWLEEPGDYTHILTLDDDCWYPEPLLPIAVLLTAARAQKQPTVVTFGGIRLDHPPYRHGDGLAYDNVGHVDVVAGFRGVLYPLEAIWPAREEFLELRHRLPPGIFNDDDAYFGMVLASRRIPVWAVPTVIPEIGLSKKSMATAAEGKESGVASGSMIPREENESQLFRFAVDRGILPNPFVASPSPLRRLLRSEPVRPVVRRLRITAGASMRFVSRVQRGIRRRISGA